MADIMDKDANIEMADVGAPLRSQEHVCCLSDCSSLSSMSCFPMELEGMVNDIAADAQACAHPRMHAPDTGMCLYACPHPHMHPGGGGQTEAHAHTATPA